MYVDEADYTLNRTCRLQDKSQKHQSRQRAYQEHNKLSEKERDSAYCQQVERKAAYRAYQHEATHLAGVQIVEKYREYNSAKTKICDILDKRHDPYREVVESYRKRIRLGVDVSGYLL